MTLPKPEYEKTLANFYYNNQFTKYIIQFMALFEDMKVSVGKNDFNNPNNLITVPIKYGSADRIVAAIKSDNTQNKLLRVPMMAAKLMNVNLAPENRKGVDQIDRYGNLPRGGVFPDDIKITYRLQPVPYKVDFELAIIASNTDQQWQILEQILMLFNPMVQFQTGDDSNDWTKINTVELTGISLDENYPSLNERRSLISTLNFSTIVYISAPVNIRNNYIKKMQLRLAAIHTYENTQEVVADVDRESPPYQKLFDIEDYTTPSS